MRLVRVSWEDLLAVPFTEMDCWAQASEIGRRIGKPLPTGAPDEGCFERVGLPFEVGDLLASDPEKKGHASHVATVVDVERGLALSTSVRAGAFCWPIRRVRRECGVWRVRLTVATG